MPPPALTPKLRRRVTAESAGLRLDVFLSRQLEVSGRTRAKALVQHGHVWVDGRRLKPGITLSEGQEVCFRVVEESVEPAAVIPLPALRVLHEDPYILVIDKPPGIAVHPPESHRAHRQPDIAAMALAHCGSLPVLGGEDRPGIVHRLDKDTSGVMVVAKTDAAFEFVKSQFKARTLRKEYRALCFGDPRFDSDWVERNIAVHPRKDRMTVVSEGGKEAATFWRVLERFGDMAWLACEPKTGRTHQIRVHMTSAGHALVGDKVYRRHRAHDALPEGAPDPTRQCLHAYRLQLEHPRTREQIVFEAPIPPDIQRLLNWLRSRG